MNIKTLFVLLFLVLHTISHSQTNNSVDTTGKAVLQKGYPVTLTLLDTISSKSSQAGDKIRFAVKEDILINGHIVIPAGTPGFGTITNASPRAGLGKKGVLEFTIDRLVFSSGKIINITSDQKAVGQNKTGAAVTEAVILTPLFLMKKGKDISYYPPKEFTAYTLQDYLF